MAQTKKKQSTRTAKKQTCSTKSTKQTCRQGSKSSKKTQCCNSDRNHIYVITAMSIIVALLLYASAAMMIA
ncbi:MAG: hypothetical protein Q4F61_00110 [Candidatus Saccharibacteria bacterium]|nr:hypothetical protein [Candidatus Saccharibacteria bacterium]